MKCQSCAREVSNLFSSCPYCGAALETAHPTAGKSAQDSLARIRADVDATKTDARREGWKESADRVLDPNDRLAPPVGRRAEPRAQAQNRHLVVKGGEELSPEHALLADIDSDMMKAEDMIRQSEYVAKRPSYEACLRNTSIVYDRNDPQINAFATSRHSPTIVVQHGFSILARLLSTILAEYVNEKDRKKLDRGFQFITTKCLDSNLSLASAKADSVCEELVHSLGVGRAEPELARSYTQTILLSVLAHEAGHICLGHTNGERLSSDDAVRNEERSADAFAASVISESPLRECLVLGQIFCNLSFVWIEWLADKRAGGRSEPTTHPRSIERLRATFRNALDAVSESGISWEFVEALLPPFASAAPNPGSRIFDTVKG